jgi:hypothetical protein
MPRDNSDLEAKLMIRRAALESVGKEPAQVLDCFAGEGHMYQEVWHRAARYLGLEQRFSRPPGHPQGEAWRGDNKMLLGRAMHKADWNVVDLDAYGSPWQLFRRLVRLTKRRRLAVTLTCGLSRHLCTGRPTPWVGQVTGTAGLSYTGMLVRWYDDVVRWTVAHCLGGTGFGVVRARRLRSAGNINMWYWLLELERSAGAEGAANPPPPA